MADLLNQNNPLLDSTDIDPTSNSQYGFSNYDSSTSLIEPAKDTNLLVNSDNDVHNAPSEDASTVQAAGDKAGKIPTT